MQHTISNILTFFAGPRVLTRHAQTSLGDYQTILRVGRRTFIGVGHTPAESRRNAIAAFDEKTGTCIGSLMADRLTMVTERASHGRMMA